MAGIERFKALAREAVPGLFAASAPTRPVTLTKGDLESLLHEMRTLDPVADRSWRNILRAALMTATRLGWYAGPVPSPIIRLRVQGSPITPQNLHLATRVDKLRRALPQHLPRLAAGNPAALAGVVLAGAILYGGLLDRALLRKFATAPLELCSYEIWNWVEVEKSPVSMDERGRRGAASRRWLPDPLTASFMLRWLAATGGGALAAFEETLDERQTDRAIWQLIRPVIEAIDGALPRFLGSLSTLLRGVELALLLHLPPLLVNFATGKLHSLSLPEHAWLRFISGKRAGPGRGSPGPQVLPAARAAVAASTAVPAGRNEQYHVLRRARKALRNAKGDREKARSGLQRLLRDAGSSPTPITAALVEWSITLMSRSGGSLKPSSCDRYMVAIVQPLVDFVGARPLQDLQAEDWVDTYESVRDRGQTPAEMGLRAGLCAQFHRWLSATGVAPPVDVAGEVGVGEGGPDGVDANIITPAEYLAARELLQGMAKEGEPYAPAAERVIQLGYDGGLRISEMFALRGRDVPRTQAGASLIVRRGKSANARRILPAGMLPSAQGVGVIAADLSGSPPDAWVLSEPGRPSEAIDQQAVIDLAVWALRFVSGDRSIHIHHLRHSHLTLIALMLLAPSKLWSRLPRQRVGASPAEDIAAHQARVQETLIGMASPTRRIAFAIALEAGHASPAVSFYSYIHLVDVALFAALRADLEKYLPRQLLLELLGIPAEQVPVLRQRKRVDSDSELLPQRVLVLNKGLREKLGPNWSRYSPQDVPPRSYLRNVVRALNELLGGATLEQVSNRFGFEAVRIRQWERSVRIIAGKTGPRGGRVFPRRALTARAVAFPINLPPTEWQLAERTRQAFARLIEQEDPGWLQEMVGFALRQGAGGHADLWFHDPKQALNFLSFLRKLGIADQALRFLHYPRDGTATQEAETDRAGWARALDIPKKSIFPVPRKTSQRRSDAGAIGIQVAAPDEEALLKAAREAAAESPHSAVTATVGKAVPRSRKRIYGSTGFWLGLRLGALLDTVVPDPA